MLRNIVAKPDVDERRRRTAALLHTLAKPGLVTSPDQASVETAQASRGWIVRRRTAALWVWRLRDAAWLEDASGTLRAPGDICLGTRDAEALYGHEDPGYLHPAIQGATVTRNDVLTALGVSGDPDVPELVGRLRILRKRTPGEGPVGDDLKTEVYLVYRALAGRLMDRSADVPRTAVERKIKTDFHGRERRIPRSPVDGAKLPRVGSGAVDEDAIPTREVDLIARHIEPYYRLSVYLQAGAGLRVSEALAFATQCRRSGALRVREQVSRTAHRADCPERFGPLKHRTPARTVTSRWPPSWSRRSTRTYGAGAPLRWAAGMCSSPGAARRRAPCRRRPPTAATSGGRCGRPAPRSGPDSQVHPAYTPHTLRHFFASTALAHGVPVHEVSRWLGHTSIKTTVDLYGFDRHP
ncbi:tyrosine-type recombinase/integrase [Streptomyces sp. N2A]|uniref:tyrosine-type recombinase/integrase n=1 Tax=Streptomyces sp. N2A TaxID=3073936 RepID=UPI002870244B|nr:tyrosine-type recombinase/integrase [Streptomyces sp. N2A]